MDWILQSKDVNGWMTKKSKNQLPICCLQETNFSSKDTHSHKVKVQKNILHTDGNQERAEIAKLRQSRL